MTCCENVVDVALYKIKLFLKLFCYNTKKKKKKSNISCTKLCIYIHVTTNMYVQ